MLQRIIDFVKGLLGRTSSSDARSKAGALGGLRGRSGSSPSGRSKSRR